MLKITNEEATLLQNKFKDFINVEPGTRPLPILADAIFKVARKHLDITKESFAEMCSLDLSRTMCGLNYPLFIDVSDLSDEELTDKKNEHGIKNRYLAKEQALGNKKYLFCKEFYIDRGGYKTKFYEWVCEMFGMPVIDYLEAIDTTKDPLVNIDNEANEIKDIVSINPEKVIDADYLRYILENVSTIMFRSEEDAVRTLLSSIIENKKIEELQVQTVEKSIQRLKRTKEILEKIDF